MPGEGEDDDEDNDFLSSGSGDLDGSEFDSNGSESDCMTRYLFHSYLLNFILTFLFLFLFHAPFENGATYQTLLQVSR